jgi:hypothetical protein
MLLQVEFAYKLARTLRGTEHTPFEASFGFTLEEPLDMKSDLQFPFHKTQHSGYKSCVNYALWNDRCYNCTTIIFMHIQSRRQPHTPLKETSCLWLQRLSYYMDRLKRSYVIDSLGHLQCKSRTINTFSY